MKLAIGTAQFGMRYGIANSEGQVSEPNIKKILAFAKHSKIDTLDTAMAYGDSEKNLGLAGVNGFKLVTKLPLIPVEVEDIEHWIVESVKTSVSRLGVDSIYGLMLHRPQQLFDPSGDKILNSIKKLKKSGLVKKIGVSVYSIVELESLYSLFDFDIVQCPLNLVDRALVDSGWLFKLKNAGVEVHTRSTFLQGLLLMSRDAIPNQFKEWDTLWDTWSYWLETNQCSPLEACLAYPLSFPSITKIIVGVDSKLQLEEIVRIIQKRKIDSFPDIASNNERLINPVNWEA